MPAIQLPQPVPAAAPASSVGANVIALSSDRAFIDLLRDSLAGMHRVWRADDVAHAGELMVTASNPVFLIDASLADCNLSELVSRVHEQFPDLAIIIAGNRDKQPSLAPLAASGAIFRCLETPASAETIRDLVDATQGGTRSVIVAPTAAPRKARSATFAGIRPSIKLPKLTLPKISVDRAWVRRWSGRCLRVVVLLLTVWALAQWKPWNYASELFAWLKPAPAAPVVIDNEARLLKLLSDADFALRRGRLVDPPGRSALELYRAALALEPGNALARSGIDAVAESLLIEAEMALKARDLPRLASAIDAARSARPDHPRLEFYSLQLQRERERKYGPEKHR